MNLKKKLTTYMCVTGAIAFLVAVVVFTDPPAAHSVSSFPSYSTNGTNASGIGESHPANTLDITNAPLNAWEAMANLTITNGGGNTSPNDPQPSDTRWVIENVSVGCNVPVGVKVNAWILSEYVNSVDQYNLNYIPLTYQGTFNGQDLYVGNSITRLYSDNVSATQGTDTGPMVLAGANLSTNGAGTCNFGLSGYLIPIPDSAP